MPTKREREYYQMGFQDGMVAGAKWLEGNLPLPREADLSGAVSQFGPQGGRLTYTDITKPKKRKLSAWNKFVKVNSKKPRFRYKSGAKRGKVNLKALGIAYRKKKR